jgi:hypothetical protein
VPQPSGAFADTTLCTVLPYAVGSPIMFLGSRLDAMCPWGSQPGTGMKITDINTYLLECVARRALYLFAGPA